MNALLIENEWWVPDFLACFLEEHPTLFEKVTKIFGARDRPDDVVEDLFSHDTVLVESTFMYYDQLQELLHLMVNKPPKTGNWTVFVVHLKSTLTRWKSLPSYAQNGDWKQFMTDVETLIQKHEVYSIDQDYDAEPVRAYNKDTPYKPTYPTRYTRIDWDTYRNLSKDDY